MARTTKSYVVEPEIDTQSHAVIRRLEHCVYERMRHENSHL